jgi:hypothetical protein
MFLFLRESLKEIIRELKSFGFLHDHRFLVTVVFLKEIMFRVEGEKAVN